MTTYPDKLTPHTARTWFEERGVWIAGDKGPEEDYPRANDGSYGGKGLWLLSDAHPRGPFDVAEVSFSGAWSRWQGAKSHWEADLRRFSLDLASKHWDPDEIVKNLDAALQSHLGKRKKVAQAAQDRARKLRALAELLS